MDRVGRASSTCVCHGDETKQIVQCLRALAEASVLMSAFQRDMEAIRADIAELRVDVDAAFDARHRRAKE